MDVLPVPRLVYDGYFDHVPAVYLQCTSPVHHPLPPVIVDPNKQVALDYWCYSLDPEGIQ